MTRDDIIRMREQADDWAEEHLQCMGEYHPDFLTVSDERFATIILQNKRSLTDAEIGAIWFEAKIPGLTETNARLLIRATERKIRELQ